MLRKGPLTINKWKESHLKNMFGLYRKIKNIQLKVIKAN